LRRRVPDARRGGLVADHPGAVVKQVLGRAQWTNDAIGEWGQNGLTAGSWDPSMFDENWTSIEQLGLPDVERRAVLAGTAQHLFAPWLPTAAAP